MTSSKPSARRAGNELGADQQLIVEEKVTKVNGEIAIKKYAKGRFLGKVLIFKFNIVRVGLLDAMNFKIWKQRKYVRLK